MYIKLTKSENAGFKYLSSIPNNISHYNSDKLEGFWYFSDEHVSSYIGFDYKFKTKEDVELLIEDMIKKEEFTELYNLDEAIKNFKIELY